VVIESPKIASGRARSMSVASAASIVMPVK
jgi:hypothetical protein